MTSDDNTKQLPVNACTKMLNPNAGPRTKRYTDLFRINFNDAFHILNIYCLYTALCIFIILYRQLLVILDMYVFMYVCMHECMYEGVPKIRGHFKSLYVGFGTS